MLCVQGYFSFFLLTSCRKFSCVFKSSGRTTGLSVTQLSALSQTKWNNLCSKCVSSQPHASQTFPFLRTPFPDKSNGEVTNNRSDRTRERQRVSVWLTAGHVCLLMLLVSTEASTRAVRTDAATVKQDCSH